MNHGNLKLEKFQNKKRNQQKKLFYTLGAVVVLLIMAVIIYRSYAIYEEQSFFNVIKGSVPEQNYDVMLSYTIEDKDGNKTSSTTIPEGRNYEVTVTCNEGAKGFWDYNEWGPNIRSLTKNRTKCNINFATTNRYKEHLLNGTDPVLANGLIPITIADNGEVKKADITTEWYQYANQKWANAVILEDESIVYQNGETIPESNIESYFVWIPRYKYKIFNTGTGYTGLGNIINAVQTIEVEFESKDVEASNGNSVGSYLTHPAFQSFDVNGIWVGKFEVGYKGATSTMEAQQNVYNSDKIEIKPNVYSWRNIQVANAHLNSYNYKREYDSHMMKNTEWGAVAYLQHSMYGSRASVRINNNSNYITGYSATAEPTCGYTADNRDCNRYEGTSLNADGTYTKRYNSEVGYLASTTNNISGIYDMSGGSWEYMMGVMLHTNGQPCAGRDATYTSGFAGPYCNTTGSASGHAFPEKKYYDTYAYGTDDEHYNRRILGDATGEMGPFANATYGTQVRQIGSWYQDEAWFVYTTEPWFIRGHEFLGGACVGVFALSRSLGSMNSWAGFRVVLAL